MAMNKREQSAVIAMIRSLGEHIDSSELGKIEMIAAHVRMLENDRDIMDRHSHPDCIACGIKLDGIDQTIDGFRGIIGEGHA